MYEGGKGGSKRLVSQILRQQCIFTQINEQYNKTCIVLSFSVVAKLVSVVVVVIAALSVRFDTHGYFASPSRIVITYEI